MQFVVAEYTGNGDLIVSREPTREAIDAEIAKMQTPDPTTGAVGLALEKVPVRSWRFCAADEYPVDRTYRDAWRDNGTAIVHDMAAAREIHRTHLRRDRIPLLEALDVEYMRGLEGNNDKRRVPEIVAAKQRLRDVTKHPRIEAAQTVDELKAATLEELSK